MQVYSTALVADIAVYMHDECKRQCLLLLCSILNSLREPETGVANCRLSKLSSFGQ